MTDRSGHPVTYADAGVDIATGDAVVEAIKPAARATSRPGADVALGGFGGVFDLKAAGFRDPLLLAATDGVGTKLKVAGETGHHRGIGIDLVAMCANDILVQGAEPLFFLDYFAMGRLAPATATEVVEGVAEGCRQAGCALIGGETAEMPGMYVAGDYDVAGFVVGAVEREAAIDGQQVTPGDVILGLASTGAHANGFSLIRNLVAETGLAYDAPAPFDSTTSLGDSLLTPTRIYVRACLPLAKAGRIRAMAHITGGGLTGNIPRSLPKGCSAELDANTWPLPPLFAWLQEAGRLPPAELAQTFNCGIGMAVIVAATDADHVAAALGSAGEKVYRIGRITAGDGSPACRITGSAGCWAAADPFQISSRD